MAGFNKPARSNTDLINLCKSRGLHIPNEEMAMQALDTIGYYRLSGYMLPFTEKSPERGKHNFLPGTSFSRIIDLYHFDRKLRLLILDAVERIEVAARATISDIMSNQYGPHWFLNSSNFKPEFDHAQMLGKLSDAATRAKDHQIFIRHYFETYDTPSMPPSWMLFEVMEFGTVSALYSSLPLEDRKTIARKLGIHHRILVSWLHSLSSLRNLCAHHARLWNRVFGISPRKAKAWQDHFAYNDRLYAQLVVVKILLDNITGHTRWAEQLLQLLEEFPDIDQQAMGMPANWQIMDLWQAS